MENLEECRTKKQRKNMWGKIPFIPRIGLHLTSRTWVPGYGTKQKVIFSTTIIGHPAEEIIDNVRKFLESTFDRITREPRKY